MPYMTARMSKQENAKLLDELAARPSKWNHTLSILVCNKFQAINTGTIYDMRAPC